jgi:hypothetical protein
MKGYFSPKFFFCFILESCSSIKLFSDLIYHYPFKSYESFYDGTIIYHAISNYVKILLSHERIIIKIKSINILKAKKIFFKYQPNLSCIVDIFNILFWMVNNTKIYHV